MNNEQKRMFLAVVLSGLVLFGWQTYFAPPKPLAVDTPAVTTEGKTSEVTTKGAATNVVKKVEVPVKTSNSVSTYTISNNGYSVDINSDLTIKNFVSPNAVFDFFATTGHEQPFALLVYSGSAYTTKNFSFSQVSPSHIQGSNSELGINVDFSMDELGKVSYRINSASAYKYRVALSSTIREEENRQIRKFAYYTQNLDYFNVGDSDEDDGKLRWISIDFNFHLFAMTFKTPLASRVKAFESGAFYATFVDELKSVEGSIVFAKKNYDHLAKLGDKLNLSIDFGFFSILAVPILRGLQFVYDYLPNYGLAIIVLTLIIRSIMFPLQFKSFKSMKKMQKIQPELNKLKEKFKDDPQRMQKETMAAFKKAGANPLGGCLPLVAQMPIFFAFYQVLYNAEEFVGSPFFGWITDLSIKDPMYVLPVLMAIAMLIQSKLNPSPTADPTQKKVMMIMPLVFGFIMKDLPAGLNLYIFTSTIYGVGQQLLVYKLTD